MPTDTIPTFQAISGVEGEPQFVVSYPHLGVVYVVGFDSFMDLLNIVASYKDRFKRPLPSDLINMIVDFAEESMEWNDQQQAHPLGVTYIGEAVCDFGEPDYAPQTVAFRHPEPIDCDCEACTKGHNSLLIARQMSDLRRTVKRQWWTVAGILVFIGVVALFV